MNDPNDLFVVADADGLAPGSTGWPDMRPVETPEERAAFQAAYAEATRRGLALVEAGAFDEPPFNEPPYGVLAGWVPPDPATAAPGVNGSANGRSAGRAASPDPTTSST